jgi:hypothetical protein
MRVSKLLPTLVALCAAGAIAQAQRAGLNPAVPTRNDYRLRLLEPAEGATLTGSSVRVVVSTEIPGQPREGRATGSSEMPRPDVPVYLDGEEKGVLGEEQNVLTVENVAPGSHAITVLAKNRSGEVIDRREIRVVSVSESAANSSAGPAKSESAPQQSSAAEPSVPKTGTFYPLIAGAGTGLLITGLLLRRTA